MNRTFVGSSGQGHSRSPFGSPPEGPASDRTTASSRDDTGSSTMSSASSSDGISTTSVAWVAAGHSDSVPAVLSSGTIGPDGKDEPGGPPPGEARSLVSLSSSAMTSGGGSTRVTSDVAPTIGTGITAKVDAAAVTMAATAPEREGLAATTLLPPSLAVAHYRVGL